MLERNPVGMIGYMIKNLCCIYNGGVYRRNENMKLLEKAIDMLNEIDDVLDCNWEDNEKSRKIIKIIANYNEEDGHEMMKWKEEVEMDYEKYYKTLDYSEEIRYDNGFCPFSRKPCMGTDCQLSVNYEAKFEGCQLAERGRG